MSGWVRFENTSAENLKVATASDKAFRLWFNAICYCSRGRTSGKVPAALITALSVTATRKTVNELLALGLLEQLDAKTYLVHDYLDYNPSRERIEELRGANRDRVARHRERSGNALQAENGNALQDDYSHTRDRSDTDTSLDVDVQTIKEKLGRAPTKAADQNEPPNGLADELRPIACSVLDILKTVQAERGGDLPTLRGVGLAMLRFPNRDYVGVAREVEHWALAGRGARKAVKDWSRTFATFLGNTSEGAPVRLVASEGRKVQRSPALEHMDRWKNYYPDEETA